MFANFFEMVNNVTFPQWLVIYVVLGVFAWILGCIWATRFPGDKDRHG
jgi:hypothetical protein